MRARWVMAIMATALVLSACTGTGSPTTDRSAVAGQDAAGSEPAVHELLLLEEGSGVMAVDASDGSVVFEQPDAVPAPDWSAVVAAERGGGSTSILELDPMTGSTVSSQQLQGDLDIRVVSEGGLVALMDPLPKGASAWTPVPRSTTTIVVADTLGSAKPERFTLEGNFEPEAFSLDEENLFLIQYLPALHPTSYRVARLYMEKGKVWPVYGRTKSANVSERMSGTRLSQVVSPDGDRLYTLYSSQPPAYAKGFDPNADGPAPVAFVHTLSTREGWAFCVPLPRAFGSSLDGAQAIAVAPGLVYVVDSYHGLISVVDTESLKVVRTARVDFGQARGGSTTATVSPDGATLYVGSTTMGSEILSLDTSTFAIQREWPVGGLVSDLALNADGSRLYASDTQGIRIFDPTSGEQIGGFGAPAAQGIGLVASAA